MYFRKLVQLTLCRLIDVEIVDNDVDLDLPGGIAWQ
jgi:hypothetical protein